ncbi:SufS family cysteine desulfurase [Iodobacter fluviatilis]|jgi:cysteine sulfinate desulfinase/cysteine desulfurase/selenocysteine lyase|uniref:Probable cysteine desulfurase n=1 Tax=Iodobacter fluviatilis TaxID=537 RepID=A0A7G3GDB3_9NEIS|nr:SufS family cysteine desulfurase [Iodobacter fluviatilis]QBC44903.1 cysteine desulfurase [Iodobacter fluviatilis]
MFDAYALRAQFPLLARTPALIYLDNAATTQKPLQVLDAERHFYETANANVHRGSHRLAVAATDAFENARSSVAHFLNARSSNEIVFTRGATEAINLVAHSWGAANLQAGDEILLSTLEHHANIVPWQMLATRCGAVIKPIQLLRDGSLDLEHFHSLLSNKTKLVGLTHISNAIGSELPIAELINSAHHYGAKVLVDGAQAVAHKIIDVQALNADFYVFSSHKAYGPTGIGALWARSEILSSMPPWQGGGEMIERVSFSQTSYAEAPARFEAGTPAIAQTIGFAAALDWLQAQDRVAIAQHEHLLRLQLELGLSQIEGIRLIGNALQKGPVVSMAFTHAHPYDVAQFLDAREIAVRVGNHCAQPLLASLGLSGTLRASFAAYNTHNDIDTLLAALSETLELLA